MLYSTQMDGDVNGKDWSRRMGDLFKIVFRLSATKCGFSVALWCWAVITAASGTEGKILHFLLKDGIWSQGKNTLMCRGPDSVQGLGLWGVLEEMAYAAMEHTLAETPADRNVLHSLRLLWDVMWEMNGKTGRDKPVTLTGSREKCMALSVRKGMQSRWRSSRVCSPFIAFS